MHTRTIQCELCNRSFGSEQALKQHREYSPVHIGTYCQACNRTFGSSNALKQHQNDSPVHQRQTSEVASSTVAPVLGLSSFLLPYNARAEAPERDTRRDIQTPSSNKSDLDSSHYPPSLAPANHPRVFTISVREPTLKPLRMPPVNIPKRKEETRTSFKFPELHAKITEAVLPEIASTWFQNDHSKCYNNEHVTCVVGSFTCDNQACKKRSWVSGVVPIVIRGYARNGYSAVVFNQRCKSCEKLGTLTMDESTYVERVAYRVKKWAGVRVESAVYNKISKGPHEEELCEGCKVGTCPYTNQSKAYVTG